MPYVTDIVAIVVIIVVRSKIVINNIAAFSARWSVQVSTRDCHPRRRVHHLATNILSDVIMTRAAVSSSSLVYTYWPWPQAQTNNYPWRRCNRRIVNNSMWALSATPRNALSANKQGAAAIIPTHAAKWQHGHAFGLLPWRGVSARVLLQVFWPGSLLCLYMCLAKYSQQLKSFFETDCDYLLF